MSEPSPSTSGSGSGISSSHRRSSPHRRLVEQHRRREHDAVRRKNDGTQHHPCRDTANHPVRAHYDSSCSSGEGDPRLCGRRPVIRRQRPFELRHRPAVRRKLGSGAASNCLRRSNYKGVVVWKRPCMAVSKAPAVKSTTQSSCGLEWASCSGSVMCRVTCTVRELSGSRERNTSSTFHCHRDWPNVHNSFTLHTAKGATQARQFDLIRGAARLGTSVQQN